MSLRWCHNELDGVLDHQPHDCLLNRLFGRRSKKTSKLRVTGLCAGNSPGTGEFPTQKASNAENVSIWWRHHVKYLTYPIPVTEPHNALHGHLWHHQQNIIILTPEKNGSDLKYLNLQHILLIDILKEDFHWNYSQVNTTRPQWWLVNVGSGNDLVPSVNKPLPEPMLSKFCGTAWHH